MGKRKHGAKRYKSGRLKVEQRIEPNDRIAQLRARFAWHRPTGEGKAGNIDQDIYDGLGQLHACGLLFADGINPLDMRDRGREWFMRRESRFSDLRVREAMPAPVHDKPSSLDTPRRIVTEEDDERAEQRFLGLDHGITGPVRRLLLEVNEYGLPTGARYLRWWEELVAEDLLARGIETPNAIGPSTGDRAKLAVLNEALAGMVQAVGQRRAA